ncbi:alpha-L-fucosidase [Pelagovum pacificum]|uniref:alpha-L-fucosidase n=1 Tax=Pelagovum pacificum TaxID=2588711 RepID=A0A5C5GDQ3_9RHOB|nr:alpha-L-fucosidase [Pelagovum pacificum]QQA44248.1 alpha-L-fucosidase [Pelagovum pacificum]TNY32630.1 alpha-L-fucosidase [Pelagovum pacificum]
MSADQPAMARTAWFTDARFGLFIHWGLYAIPARHEWVQTREQTPPEDYAAYLDQFDPDLFDPADWARKAKAAGMRYVVVTAKHHEGFCLWDSAFTDFKATNTPFGRDALRDILDAFRAEGLRVGIYYSLIDWHHPDFTIDPVHPLRNHPDAIALNAERDMERYRSYMFAQVEELLTGYGPLDIIWFDFSYPDRAENGLTGKGRDDWNSEALLALVRRLAPGIIVNNRLGLPEEAPDVVTPEQLSPPEWPERDGARVTWEACHTLSGPWGYARDMGSAKSPGQLIRLLADTVSKGGNLLMNVGPTARGEFDPQATEALETYATWMHHHAPAIRGCTAADLPPAQDCRLTRKGDRLYVHVFAWPFRHLHLPGLQGKVSQARLMTDGGEVGIVAPAPDDPHENMQIRSRPGDLVLELPVKKPDAVVPVIELALC